jgi:hypothetical protein
MQVDFSDVQDVENYLSVPEGTYLCRIAEVRQGVTRDGNPRWSLRLEVAEGDYAGKTAAWDGLNWTERGMPRVKKVLARLGFDVSGILDLQPDELVGRRVQAQLLPEEREDRETGRRITSMRVPYMGYEAVEQDAAPF